MVNVPRQLPGLTLGTNPSPGSLAAGAWHGLAIQDGRPWTWGNNGNGELGDGTTTSRSNPAPVKGLDAIAALAGGMQHSLALTREGAVWAWGDNGNGQLGDGTTDERHTPISVPGLASITALMAGDYHSLALSQDGTVWAWGQNDYGQIGDGTTIERHRPVQLAGISGVKTVVTGSYHTLALQPDGTVWAWGDNHNGQIGSGVADQGLHPVPVRVTGLSDIKTVAAGNWHNLALSQDGKVWAWGWNEFGQLGDGTTIERHSPVRVTGLPPIVALAAGFGHSLALARDGTLWAWGWNGFGQIGDGTTTNWYSPIRVTGIEGVVALAAGAYSNLVQVRDGTLWAWGDNGAGQLGLAGATQRAIPGLVEGLSDVVQLAAGWEHNLARTSDGAVWAWGGNGYGQLGYNSLISNYSHPVRVASLKPATTVSAGHLFSLALVAGQVWAWGQNNHGQLGQGTTDIYVHGTPVVIPGLPAIQGVSAGMGHSLALARDGRVWAWGSNLNGQLGDNSTTDRWGPVQVTGLDSVVAVAAGHYHSLALKQDGSLWAWGYNADGRLGDGTQIQRLVPIQVTGLGPVQRIAAGVGADHSLALTRDGQAWSWGNNSFGQLGLGEADSKAHPIPQAIPNLTKVTNFSGGWKSTLAVRQDGTVWACGNNDSGELGDGTFAAHATPVLAENTTLDGILDLDLATPNDIPQGSLPSFLMDTVKIGNLASVVLSVRVNLAPLTPGGLAAALPNSYQSMNMYVAANAPPGAQTPVCMPQTALSDPSWWVWEKANTGGGSALVWPIGAFKSNVPDDYSVPTELIVNCDLRGQTDTAIYLDYGTSADEMLNVWRVREMYRVPAP